MPMDPVRAGADGRRRLRWWLAAGLLAAIAGAVVHSRGLDVAGLAAWVDSLGALGPLLFVLVYALGTVLLVPGSVFTLAGGALFGPVLGLGANLVAATLGATLAFLVGRYLAHDWVQARLGGRTAQLVRGVEAEGWRFVAFTRLVPLFPFNLLNYALGLTRIGLVSYLWATCVFMLPATAAFTYLGHVGREALAGGDGLAGQVLVAIGLLALAWFVPRLARRLRRNRVPVDDEAPREA
jgi:uncharacterized membrane protein YdjX (TVP38/TMEM64 family)